MKDTSTAMRGMETLDSRGDPTVRFFVALSDGTKASASVPSGASTPAKARQLKTGSALYYW